MMHTPYGYKIINGQAVIDEPVADKARLLFTEFLNCRSMRAAAIKAGIEKTHSVIGRILKNEVYLGDKYYPQLIEEETFRQVQLLRNKNAKEQNRIQKHKKKVPAEEKSRYRLRSVSKQFDDPYEQAEYAYGLIEEVSNE